MPTYLTTQQAALVLGMAPGTLSNWRSLGAGPRYVRLGARSIRYTNKALQEWVESAN